MESENRKTTKKDQWGNEQPVNENQQYSLTPEAREKYANELDELRKGLKLKGSVKDWKHFDRMGKKDFEFAIKVFKGEEVTYEECNELPILKWAQEELAKTDRLNPVDPRYYSLQKQLEEDFYNFVKKNAEEKGITPTKGRKAVMILGYPASGKSSALEHGDFSTYMTVDSDDVKSLSKLSRWFNGGIGASVVQQISSDVQLKVLNRLLKEGYNVCLPYVGKNKKGTIDKLKNIAFNGYQIDMKYKKTPIGICLGRTCTRLMEDGRLVDPAYLWDVAVGWEAEKTWEGLGKEIEEKGALDNGTIKINSWETV